MRVGPDKHYVNLTPHELHYWWAELEEWVTFAPDGRTVRVQETLIGQEVDGWVTLTELDMGKPDWVPEEEADTIYIVSRPAAMVLAALYPLRTDFYFPDNFIRDDEGVIQGCERFARYVIRAEKTRMA